MEPKTIISTQLLQQAVDYLQTRPYNEVNQLVTALVSGSEPYEVPKKEKK